MFGFGGPRDSQKNVGPGSYDWALALKDIRETLGPAPRKVRAGDRITFPDWAKTDDLKLIAASQDRLLARGQVGWGALAQANSNLFSPGPGNHPGNLLYSLDPKSFANPGIMIRAAHGLYNVKGKQADPELQVFADTLADEMERLMKVRVPTQLTGSLECFFTSVMFERRHLPRGVLTGSLMPVLINPDADAIVVVPYRHWPASLIRALWGPA